MIVKLLKELNWFAQLCVLMLTANAFAQPPALDLQDSLDAEVEKMPIAERESFKCQMLASVMSK